MAGITRSTLEFGLTYIRDSMHKDTPLGRTGLIGYEDTIAFNFLSHVLATWTLVSRGSAKALAETPESSALGQSPSHTHLLTKQTNQHDRYCYRC